MTIDARPIETYETLNGAEHEPIDRKRPDRMTRSWIDTECRCPEHCLRDHDNE